MFDWFFGSKPSTPYNKVMSRSEHLIKDISKTQKALDRDDDQQLQNAKERLAKDLLHAKEIVKLLTRLDRSIITVQKELTHLQQFAGTQLKDLQKFHVVIEVVGRKFKSIQEFMTSVDQLSSLFSKVIQEDSSAKSLSPQHFDAMVSNKLQEVLEDPAQIRLLDETSAYLKDFVAGLKEIKGFLNLYYHEYELLKKLAQEYGKGKRDAQLIESVFGKAKTYDFERSPRTRRDLVNRLIHNMQQSMTHDEVNRVMHRLRMRRIDQADFLTRGLSDNEAKIFASTIAELAGPLGIYLRKNLEADGYGFIHSRAHAVELIDVINPSFKSVKGALEATLKNAKFNLPSRGCRFLCNPIRGGRFFLIAITHPDVGFVTFYHADDSSGRKGLVASIKAMVQAGNIPHFRNTNGERDYIIVLKDTVASVYYIRFTQDSSSKVSVRACKENKMSFSNTIQSFKESSERRAFGRFVEKHQGSMRVDLRALSA